MGNKPRNDDLKRIKKELRELKREVRELEKIVREFMAAPQKAMLAFFGIAPTEEVFDGDGLGIEYVRIQKANKEQFLKELQEEAPEIIEEVLPYLENKENRQGLSSKKKA